MALQALTARRLLLRLQHQPRGAAAAFQMRLEDLVDIGGVAIAVTDAFGIDHHRPPELAAIEAAGGIDPSVCDCELPCPHPPLVSPLLAAFLRAATARMGVPARICAAVDMQAVG